MDFIVHLVLPFFFLLLILFICLSVCFLSCLWALLPDLNKMMMIIMAQSFHRTLLYCRVLLRLFRRRRWRYCELFGWCVCFASSSYLVIPKVFRSSARQSVPACASSAFSSSFSSSASSFSPVPSSSPRPPRRSHSSGTMTHWKPDDRSQMKTMNNNVSRAVSK